MEKPNYATVITSVAVAVMLMLFGLITNQIKDVECRLRSVEIQLAAISVGLGIYPPGLASSTRPQSGAAVAAPLEDCP